MFERLFKRKKPVETVKDDWEQRLAWLPVGHPQNPFPMEVLDCRPLAVNYLAMTTQRSVAESFTSLRHSDGRNLCGCLPENALVVDCTLRYHSDGRQPEGTLFMAKEMEDKWDIFVYDSRLYIRESWTGNLTHVAELEFGSKSVTVRDLQVSSGLVFEDPIYAICQLDFLFTTHLCRKSLPFPIPKHISRIDCRQIALLGISNYGRFAQFGAYPRPDQPE